MNDKMRTSLVPHIFEIANRCDLEPSINSE